MKTWKVFYTCKSCEKLNWMKTLCRRTTIICTAECQRRRLTLCKNVQLFHSSKISPNSINNKAILSQTSGPTHWDRKMVSWTNIDDQLQCLVEYYEHFPHSHHSRALISVYFISFLWTSILQLHTFVVKNQILLRFTTLCQNTSLLTVKCLAL